MVTSRTRRIAGLAVALGASAALLAGTATAPTASALSIGDVGVLPLAAACDAGSGVKDEDRVLITNWLNAEADCTDSSKAVLVPLADGVLGLFLPDLGLSTGSLNGAAAVGLTGLAPAKAKIKGTGYTTALSLVGGNSSATADYYFALAIALASGGSTSTADALFGSAVALSTLSNTADAQALPWGVALSNSSGVLKTRNTSATALLGIASASSAIDGAEDAVCTAAYGQASVAKKNGDNVTSCTSVLYIFQQHQDGSGPVWYAIKNPLDLDLVSPFGDDIADLLSTVGGGVTGGLLPEQVLDLLAGKFVPAFGSDIVRVSFDGTPKIESDLADWLGSLFGATSAGGTVRTAAYSSTPALSFLDDDRGISGDEAGDAAPAKLTALSTTETRSRTTSGTPGKLQLGTAATGSADDAPAETGNQLTLGGTETGSGTPGAATPTVGGSVGATGGGEADSGPAAGTDAGTSGSITSGGEPSTATESAGGGLKAAS